MKANRSAGCKSVLYKTIFRLVALLLIFSFSQFAAASHAQRLKVMEFNLKIPDILPAGEYTVNYYYSEAPAIGTTGFSVQ